jgi:hypothetical protein
MAAERYAQGIIARFPAVNLMRLGQPMTVALTRIAAV